MLFLFCVIDGLIDSMLDDCGLQRTSLDRSSLAFGSTDMDVDSKKSHNLGKQEFFEELRCKNSLMAMEVLGKLTESKKTTLLLRLVHINMYACHSLFIFSFRLAFHFVFTFFGRSARFQIDYLINLFPPYPFIGPKNSMALCTGFSFLEPIGWHHQI